LLIKYLPQNKICGKLKCIRIYFKAQNNRLINPLSNPVLKIIEVQSGSYRREDYTERFEDQFGR
jgi:hypothetical protein